MPLFSRKERSPQPPRMRTADCIYRGEPFPQAGERIDLSGIEADFLYDRGAIPPSWTAIVRSIRERTGEPSEPRVATNVLGTLLAMMANTFNKLGAGLGLEASASKAQSMLREGADEVSAYRSLFASAPAGSDAFDFELIKVASLLASPRAAASRREGGWAYPDIWTGDLSRFSL